MSILSKLIGLGAGRASQAISRILPTSEERILGNLMRSAPNILKETGGFSFDPRRGRFLQPGQQSGFMMGTLPNNPALAPVQAGGGVARNVTELIDVAKQSNVLPRLRRGEYIGGWDEGQGMGLDPARRHLTKFGAIRSGLRTNQAAGFDLRKADTFDVTKEALRKEGAKLAAKTGAVATTVGVPAALSPQGKDFLSALRGGKEPVVETPAEKPEIYQVPTFQYGMAKPVINEFIKAGVKVSDEGGFGQFVKVAKNRLQKIGLTIEDMSGVSDDLSEAEGALRLYEIVLNKFKNAWGTQTAEQVAATKNKMLSQPKLKSNVNTKWIQDQKNNINNLKPDKVYANRKTSNSIVTQEFADMGSRSVRNAADQNELYALYRGGKADKFEEAVIDIRENLNTLLTKDEIELLQKKEAPDFYTIFWLLNKALGGKLNMSSLQLNLAQGPASAASPPVPEVRTALGALLSRVPSVNKLPAEPFPNILEKARLQKIKELKLDIKGGEKLFKAQGRLDEYLARVEKRKQLGLHNKITSKESAKKAGLEDAWTKQKNAERLREKRQLEEGYVTNVLKTQPKEIQTAAKVVRDFQKNVVKWFEDPTKFPGIREKIYAYMGGKVSPMQDVSSVMDSWMLRIMFGNNKLSTAKPGDEYKLVHELFNDYARSLGIKPAVLQEHLWMKARIINNQYNEAFLPFDDLLYQFPLAKPKANLDKIPSLDYLAPELQPFADEFNDDLLNAIKANPELARMFRVVGEDLELVPEEFFAALNSRSIV